MATIEKLDSIIASKTAIKAAIQEKGVSCDDTLAEYANRIMDISALPPDEVQAHVVGDIAVGKNFIISIDVSTIIIDKFEPYPITCVVSSGEDGQVFSYMFFFLRSDMLATADYCILEETRDSHYVVKLEYADMDAEISATILEKVEK